jgi:hypothetical protein
MCKFEQKFHRLAVTIGRAKERKRFFQAQRAAFLEEITVLTVLTVFCSKVGVKYSEKS